MTPTCPQDYSCTFTLLHPRVIEHAFGPWYQGTAGWVVAIVISLAIAGVAMWGLSLIADARQAHAARLERERDRQHQLAVEEQRTIQADAAKGDVEFLRTLRADR